MMEYCYLDSPLGALLLAGQAETLSLLSFPEGKRKRMPGPGWQERQVAFVAARQQLQEYFAGKRREFALQLAPQGTPFQLSVLDALGSIPYGTTLSYQEVAARIGRPKAVRAVGAANGRNPLPIVIPCHRVIGADGSLTGFGGGLEAKRYLLALESSASGAGINPSGINPSGINPSRINRVGLPASL